MVHTGLVIRVRIQKLRQLVLNNQASINQGIAKGKNTKENAGLSNLWLNCQLPFYRHHHHHQQHQHHHHHNDHHQKNHHVKPLWLSSHSIDSSPDQAKWPRRCHCKVCAKKSLICESNIFVLSFIVIIIITTTVFRDLSEAQEARLHQQGVRVDTFGLLSPCPDQPEYLDNSWYSYSIFIN